MITNLNKTLILVVLLLPGFVGLSCSREPLAIICPKIDPGALAISEIRGKQSSSEDPQGQWIEIYNSSANDINPWGLSVILQKLDGSDWQNIVIHSPLITLSPGDYLVLGNFDNSDLPTHVDFGYIDDFTTNIYSDGLVEVYACTKLIDRVVYYNLPSTGSLSFDGSLSPDATTNDQESNWCVDDSGLSAPGTPGEDNNPC